MKVKLRTWLVFCLFGISSIFSIAIFLVVQQGLEDNLLKRTKDQLNSINILKKRLVEQILFDQQNEIANILEYQQSRQTGVSDLVDAISSIPDVSMIGLKSCESCDFAFQAATVEDSSYYRFEYSLDSIKVLVYLDYFSIGSILQERTGLGKTGESYLVGSNLRMLSESIFFPDSVPQTIACSTKGATEAFSGREGVEVYPDYRGVPIIGVYRLISFGGLEMAILTEIDLEEAMEPIREIREKMLIMLAAIIIWSFFGSAGVAELLARPVRRLSAMMDQLTLGKLPEKSREPEYISEFSVIISSMNRLIQALKSTVTFAQQIGEGRMAESYEMLSEEDELGRAVLTMRDQLVVLDKQKSQLERQSKKNLIEGQETERERIARDLHDGLGAMLTTMKLKLGKSLGSQASEEFRKLLDDAIKEARNLSRNLMPSVLMDFGIYDALEQLCETTQQSTGFQVQFNLELDKDRTSLEKTKQVHVYRIVQEAINNAIKHSGGSEIAISVTEFDDQINLFIKDNGKGFDKKQLGHFEGIGFRNIQERTEVLNGQLIIDSNSDGTILEVDFPI